MESDLGAGVQKITGLDAISTVTLATAAGDLSQSLISEAAGRQELACALDDRVTRSPGPVGECTAQAPPCMLTCWGPVGMHSA